MWSIPGIIQIDNQLTVRVTSGVHRAIDSAVRRIVGVKGLQEHLHVRPPDATAPDDRGIVRAANRALRWDARVPKGIRAEVTGGVLRLIGVQ